LNLEFDPHHPGDLSSKNGIGIRKTIEQADALDRKQGGDASKQGDFFGPRTLMMVPKVVEPYIKLT
jgi:hypothetical protein